MSYVSSTPTSLICGPPSLSPSLFHSFSRSFVGLLRNFEGDLSAPVRMSGRVRAARPFFAHAQSAIIRLSFRFGLKLSVLFVSPIPSPPPQSSPASSVLTSSRWPLGQPTPLTKLHIISMTAADNIERLTDRKEGRRNSSEIDLHSSFEER